MIYSCDGYSDVGGRENNEDSFFLGETEKSSIFVVADGLGGHDSGEIASGIVISSIASMYETSYEKFNVLDSINYANQSIIRKQKEANKRMLSTVAVVFLDEKEACFAHVGDTRIYVFLGDKIIYQSLDHSAAQIAVDEGKISFDELRNYPKRNILTRALGASNNTKITFYQTKVDSYDAILICSDGFWEYVSETEMIQSKTNVQNASQWLFNMRTIIKNKDLKNNDNNTAITIIKRSLI